MTTEAQKEFFVAILPKDIARGGVTPIEAIARGPLVMETYLTMATKANAHQSAKRLNSTYGECLIGRVTIEAMDQINPPQIAADLLRKKDTRAADIVKEILDSESDYEAELKLLEWLRNL